MKDHVIAVRSSPLIQDEDIIPFARTTPNTRIHRPMRRASLRISRLITLSLSREP